VEVTPDCLNEGDNDHPVNEGQVGDEGGQGEEALFQSVDHFTIALAAQQNSTIPLHVTFCASEKGSELYFSLRCFLDLEISRYPTPSIHPITYEIFGMNIREDTPWVPLVIACKLQAVVHFDPTTRAGTEEDAVAIGIQLFDCVADCLSSNTGVYGQLYLCDIPDIVLYPDEIALANDVDDAAKLKLFNILLPPFDLDLDEVVRPKWEEFNSRIHLVKSGFRPSRADMRMVDET
jgi:hypothetical protein